MYRKIILFILLVPLFGISQTDHIKDSLLYLAKNAPSDTLKVKKYNDLITHLQATNPTEVKEFGLANLELAKKCNFRRGEALALRALGEYYNAKGNYSAALEMLINASKIYISLRDYKNASSINYVVGNTYLGLDDIENAYRFYKTAYDDGEKVNSKLSKAYASTGLSNVHAKRGDFSKAIEELMYSKMVFENANKDFLAAFVYVNLSENYNSLKQLDSSAYYANLALPIMLKYNSRYGQLLTYMCLGDIDFSKDKYNSALNYYFKTLQIAEEDNAVDNQKNVCLQIFKLFEKKDNAAQALAYYKKYIILKDSIYNAGSRNKLLEIQTKYDTDAKEKQNIMLQQDQVIAKKSLQTQRLLSYCIVGVLILVFVFTYISFKNLKKQKRMNFVLQEQKELVEQSRKEILDSILYAKRIQNTILAHKEFITENIKNNFVYFRPKDIVSGDFYWATKRNDLFYLAVCDSTGHGVPGAFMSLLSISFLNEAIGEKNITKPNEIFNYVRQKLIENISKEGQKDGFDGILLCINQSTKEITYTAANNRPVVVTDNKLIELTGDRMPVGYGERKESFTLHTIDLKKEDTLYLFTDGYPDQFGGPKGKKLMYKKLHEYLLSISSELFVKQNELLGKNFEEWKGNLEQIDDVCVVGLKFS